MMEKRLAIFVSRSFNPLIITSIYLIILLQLQLQFTGVIPVKARWMIMGLILITTYIVPALVMNLIAVWLNRAYNLEQKNIRLIHQLIFAIFYLLAYHLLQKISLSPVFTLFILGMASLAVISMLLSTVLNVSVYMLAAGALAGAFLGMHLTLQINMIVMIIIALIIGGLSGFSRLYLQSHKPIEIYTGYFLGAVIMLLHFIYL